MAADLNATDLETFRSTTLDTPIFNLVSGSLHILWFCLDVGTLLLWYRNVRFKKSVTGNYKGVTRGARLIIWSTFCTTVSELGYLGFIGGGFERSGGVVGNDTYETNQIGYLSGHSTTWCSFSSYCLYWGLGSMLTTTWLLMRHVYKLAITTGRASAHTSLHDNSWCGQLRQNPSYLVAIGLPVVMVVLQGTLSQQGPMGAYCGIRCVEYGMDTAFTSHNRCWVRLVAFYWLCLTFGPVVLFDAFRLVQHIRSVHKLSERSGADQDKMKELRKSKKNKSSSQMRDRLTRFAVLISIAMFGASIMRISSSMNPDAMKEGKNGLTEYFGLVISPFMVMTFSIGLWSDFFGCSTDVQTSNASFVRRNSGLTNSASGSGRNSGLRKSDLSSAGLPLVQPNSSGSAYVVQKQVSDPLAARDSSLGANSSMSTEHIITSAPMSGGPSAAATPSKYAATKEEDGGEFNTERA